MGIQTFNIRQATIDDLDILTELHMVSFKPEQHLPVLIGKRYVKATYKWQITSGNGYVLVADEGNKIIGLLGACDFPYVRPMFKACLKEFILCLLLSPGKLFNKQLWQRVFLETTTLPPYGKMLSQYPGIAQITIGAVDSQHRGKGIFNELALGTEKTSKSRGSRAIRVGIHKYNDPSKKVFIKNGWGEVPELETQDTVFFMTYLDPTLPLELETKFKQLSE